MSGPNRSDTFMSLCCGGAVVLCLSYFIALPVFVLLSRIALAVYQIAMVTEWTPEPFSSIEDLWSRWSWLPPTWLLWIEAALGCCALGGWLHRRRNA
jgi:hypothetical protein